MSKMVLFRNLLEMHCFAVSNFNNSDLDYLEYNIKDNLGLFLLLEIIATSRFYQPRQIFLLVKNWFTVCIVSPNKMCSNDLFDKMKNNKINKCKEMQL